jgi:hypothetical protein
LRVRASGDVDGGDPEILPVVVVTHAFPARPSSLPEIRDFVRRHAARTSFSEDDIRALGERTAQELLAAAGTSDTIQVSLRIFADRTEVDVLRSEPAPDAGRAATGSTGHRAVAAPRGADAAGVTVAGARPGPAVPAGAAGGGGPAAPTAGPGTAPFTEWFAAALRREGMTMDAAARQLGVSVKTVSRWMSGTTEPRWRDLSRIREIFGELPLP